MERNNNLLQKPTPSSPVSNPHQFFTESDTPPQTSHILVKHPQIVVYIGLFLIIKHNCNCMDFQKDYQYHFERMFQDSFMIQYLLQPLILFLIIILIYVFIKKKLLRDEKEDLESLKLLQELLDSGTINDNEFQKKKNRITSKW